MSEKVAKIATKITKKDNKQYVCEDCDYTCYIKSYYTKHLGAAKHKNKLICEKVANIATKITPRFLCEICHYNTSNKSDYTKHLTTSKHKKKNMFKNDGIIPENNTSSTISSTTTSPAIDSSTNEIKILTELVVELVKSNNELQRQMINVCQKIQPSNNHSNNTNTNSHNKTFNLQLFLNEECKDAMNLSEFINSIQPKISDLENIGKVGYVEGISNIIIKQLNNTQVNKRPVHCSDSKRETLYVKEEDKWEKETEETKKMVNAVQRVDKKTSHLLLTEWKDTHPNFMDSKSRDCKDFTNLAGKILNGDETNVNKVIKKVANQVVIDK